MKAGKARQLRRTIGLCAALAASVSLAACGAQPTKTASASKTRSKEYFAESEWGVKASPRVSQLATNLPRGGGREQIGRPYQVRGQWYHPKEDPNYSKTGMASWYGDAFHGRLTANGEVYDMTHLTAAHPTMPLPSYARVTNLDNGNSVIVRVNDRGPFTRGRVIDLSRRAAEMLDYHNDGVAKVQVDYVGRAPLHGQDDQYLMASFTPGAGDGYPQPSTMIAMNGPTPTTVASVASPIVSSFGASVVPSQITLPTSVGLPVRRPSEAVYGQAPSATPVLGYAEARMGKDSDAFAALIGNPDANALADAWQRSNADRFTGVQGPHVAIGTFETESEARRMADRLAGSGEVRIMPTNGGLVSVAIVPDGRLDLDGILKTAWANGAADAMTVRD
jgi:rare lipoprotein A